MAIHRPDQLTPHVKHFDRWRNGRTPHPGGIRSIANDFNRVSCYARKLVFAHYYETGGGAAPSPASTTSELFWLYRSGENTKGLRAVIGFIPSDASPAAQPNGRIRVTDDGSTYSTARTTTYYNRVNGSSGLSWTPAEVYWAFQDIVGLDSNTIYRGDLQLDNEARIASILVYETAPGYADDSVTGCCDPTPFEEYGPIRSEDIQDVITTGTKLWQHNATPLCWWSKQSSTGYKDITSTSYVNIVDGSTSSLVTDYHWRVNTTRHNSFSQSTVPVEVAVYAERTAGTGTLDIQFDASSGTDASLTGVSAASSPCASGASTFAAGDVRVFPRARVSNGTTTWRIHAVAMWEYEA